LGIEEEKFQTLLNTSSKGEGKTGRGKEGKGGKIIGPPQKGRFLDAMETNKTKNSRRDAAS